MNQIRASLLHGLAISTVTAGAGAAFFAALLSRFGEGGYDAYRAANDIIKRSDVGAAEQTPAARRGRSRSRARRQPAARRVASEALPEIR
jgi:hypothetical protein